MKKLIAITLMLIYFTVTTGFTVSMHYCMNELESAKIGAPETEVCNKCGMETNDGCCRSEVKVIKLQQDQSQAFFTFFNFSFTPTITATGNYIFSSTINNGDEDVANCAHAPPFINRKDTYLVNCVFRI